MIDNHIKDIEELKAKIKLAKTDNLPFKPTWKNGKEIYPLGRIIPYDECLLLAFSHFNEKNEAYIFYLGADNSPKPMYKDVADIIHKAGGLVFLAHPFEYKLNDTIDFIDKLSKNIKLDGIECFHPSAEIDNRIEILIEYARKNNVFISGGSDFHGDKKPNNEIGRGSGSLEIPKEYIEEWVNL